MKTVAIIGVGLIGGSFALALRKAGFRGKIVGVSSPRTVEAALVRGAIDEALPLEKAVPQADFVYLAQPILRILDSLDRIAPLLSKDSFVTDAGSTKAAISERACRAIRNGQFLGGHPMAGKEKRGVQEAEADLFVGRTYVLTPSDASELETPAAKDFVEWLGRIGAVPVVLSPAEHDRIVAQTSHLPQMASTALAATLAERLGHGEHVKVAGPGLMDMTRLALSDYEIWADILATNAGEIERALDAYIARLKSIRAGLRDERMRAEFAAATEFAARLRGTDS